MISLPITSVSVTYVSRVAVKAYREADMHIGGPSVWDKTRRDETRSVRFVICFDFGIGVFLLSIIPRLT